MEIPNLNRKFKSALIALSFIAVCNTSFAEKSTEDMVENSIKTLSAVNKITSLIANQNELSRLAMDEPYSPRDAAVVFKKPKTAAQLLAWAETNELTLINLEAKFPIGDLVFKARFQDLESLDGSIKDKMDYLKGRHEEAVNNIIKEKELKLSLLIYQVNRELLQSKH